MKKKSIVLMLACVMLLGVAMGGTLAWLTDKTEAVTNTFTDSDINITLTETKPEDHTAKMVPGDDIAKDPKVTVEEGSEACWLFIKVAGSTNANTYLTYSVSDDWTAVPDHTGYYYYNGTDLDDLLTDDVEISILKDNKVTVKGTVTKADMDAIDGVNADADAAAAELAARPTLSFTAAAVQKAHIDTVTAAWNELPADFKS